MWESYTKYMRDNKFNMNDSCMLSKYLPLFTKPPPTESYAEQVLGDTSRNKATSN